MSRRRGLILGAYGDDDVTRLLVARFASVRRPLAFHVGQAPLSLERYREIGRLVQERFRDA